MEGRGEPRNLDNSATVSHKILQTDPQNLVNFSAENCGPYLCSSMGFYD